MVTVSTFRPSVKSHRVFEHITSDTRLITWVQPNACPIVLGWVTKLSSGRYIASNDKTYGVFIRECDAVQALSNSVAPF